jgi:hypothetical protein
MAINQPCTYCSRNVISPEYWAHNVVCNKPECVERKIVDDARMQAALDRAYAEIEQRRAEDHRMESMIASCAG